MVKPTTSTSRVLMAGKMCLLDRNKYFWSHMSLKHRYIHSANENASKSKAYIPLEHTQGGHTVSVSHDEVQISCFFCTSFLGKHRFKPIFFGKAQKCGNEVQIFGKAHKCFLGKCRCRSVLSQKGNPKIMGKHRSFPLKMQKIVSWFIGCWESADFQSGKMGFPQWESAENYWLFWESADSIIMINCTYVS